MLKLTVKRFLRTRFCVFLLATLGSLLVKKVAHEGRKKAYLLVLNYPRFKNDLHILNAKSDIGFLVFPLWLHTFLNAICIEGKHSRADYIKAEKPEVLKDRGILHAFVPRFIHSLKTFIKFEGLLTCSFYYVQDQEWDAACDQAGIPFIAIYKENLKYEIRREYAEKLYQDRGYRFRGTKLLVFEYISKEVLAKAKVASPEKIEVIGMPRGDAIWNKLRQKDHLSQGERQKAVLFSFRHAIAGTLTTDSSFEGCFSLDRKQGVVELFDLVHGGFAQMAIKHPEMDFIIKPKWLENWADKIEEAIFKATGKRSDNIPNLKITENANVHDLILSSKVIIGINSTTLIESLLLGIPTLIPFFAEAKDRYPHEILFRDFFDIYHVAQSNEEFLTLLETALIQGLDPRPASGDMIRRYIGFFDGQNSSRFEASVHSTLSLKSRLVSEVV